MKNKDVHTINCNQPPNTDACAVAYMRGARKATIRTRVTANRRNGKVKYRCNLLPIQNSHRFESGGGWCGLRLAAAVGANADIDRSAPVAVVRAAK